MAKYCRHCGEKMSAPKDKYCYKCRTEGNAVDWFYRYIREEDKFSLTESEQDILRSDGFNTFIGCCILGFAPLVLAIIDIYMRLSGYGALLSNVMLAVIFVLLAVLIYIGMLGIQLFMLKKKFFKFNFNIVIYKCFNALVFLRTSAKYIVHMVGTLPKKLKRVDYIEKLIVKLVSGEAASSPVVNEKPQKEPEKNWRCGFCGYENSYSAYQCKSCGKERIRKKK